VFKLSFFSFALGDKELGRMIMKYSFRSEWKKIANINAKLALYDAIT
jgi:hypothetical protein